MAIHASSSRRRWGLALALLGSAAAAVSFGLARSPLANDYVVFAYNELGMHCMQQDFSQMMILPPYNNLRAQVIRRGESPDIMSPSDVAVTYELASNTHSADKCNFWTYSKGLLGNAVPPDVGLAGQGLAGTMTSAVNRQFIATGIPLTPIEDSGRENPYQLATVTASMGNTVVARTQTVVPVSWEMSCNICHNTPGEPIATNILKAHDRLHSTNLMGTQPVFCASCHADPAVGSPGQPGVKSLSAAMHGAHASRMDAAHLDNACYACHPGFRTQCLRDVHSAKGITCTNCHGSMAAVGSTSRTPWVDEPKCATCHTKAGYEFEQPNTLFRDSVGHMGVACMACHGSPHAITPTSNAADNVQAIAKQGHAGTIDTCTVCHTVKPNETFPHRRND